MPLLEPLYYPGVATMDEPALTVVVPTRNRPVMLDRCLSSLRRSLVEHDELVVVDSASTDPQVRIAVEGHGARYLRMELPGASRARNAGWRSARHSIIAFVDDDVTVSPEWASAVRQTMRDHPEATFAVGRLAIPPDQGDVERPVSVRDEPGPTVIGAATRGDLGHSANLTLRRRGLEEVGGFDEALGAGARFRACEDGDLIDRLVSLGHEGRYQPEILGWHDQWRDRRALLRLDWSYGIGFGARLMKLLRADPRRSRLVAWDFLWVWGLALIPPAVRKGYEYGVAFPLMRIGGAIVGMAAAAPLRVREGHFRLPSWARERRIPPPVS